MYKKPTMSSVARWLVRHPFLVIGAHVVVTALLGVFATRVGIDSSLANVLPSAELFYGLVGGREEFEKLIGTSAMAAEDLVLMAERIKRDLEAKARSEENQAEHAEGRARGAREAAAGVDVNAECDAAKLQAILEIAVRQESQLAAQREAATKASRAAQLAQDQLEDAEASYKGLTLGELPVDYLVRVLGMSFVTKSFRVRIERHLGERLARLASPAA